MSLLSKQDLRALFNQLGNEYEYLSNNRIKLEADCKKLQECIETQITQIKSINEEFEKLRQEYIHHGANSSKAFSEMSDGYKELGIPPSNDQTMSYGQQNQLYQQSNTSSISSSYNQISAQNQRIDVSQQPQSQYINEQQQQPMQNQQMQEEQPSQDWELTTLVSADQIKSPIIINLFAEIVDTSVICSTSFSPDGNCLAIGSDHMLRVYNLKEDSFLMEKSIENVSDANSDSHNYVRSIVWTLDGKTVICGSDDSKIRSFDLNLSNEGEKEHEYGKMTHCFATGSGDVFQLQISNDGTFFAAVTSDGCLTIYSTNSDTENEDGSNYARYKTLASLSRENNESEPASATSLSISYGDKYVAVGYSDGSVTIWDVESKLPIANHKCHAKDIYAVKFLPNERLVTASLDFSMKIWDIDIKEKVITKAENDQKPPETESKSTDNEEKTTVEQPPNENEKKDENVEVKNKSEDENENKNKEKKEEVEDKNEKASGYIEKVTTIEKEATLTLWRDIEGHKDFVLSLAVDPSGTWLLSGSKDMTARLTSLIDGVMVYSIKAHENSIITVCFNPNGKMFCTGSGDNAVKIWSISPEEDVDD